MSEKTIALGFSNLTVRSGSHIAFPFCDEFKRQETLLSYVSEGLRRGEKCITAVCDYPLEFWIEGLKRKGIELPSENDNRLSILTPSKLVGNMPNAMQINPMVAIEDEVTSALSDGRVTRICTGFDHLYYDPESIRLMLESEFKTDIGIVGNPITVLCSFDASRLSPRVLDACIRYHPLITDGHSISTNEKYSPGSSDPASAVHRIVESRMLERPLVSLDFINDMPIIQVGGEMDCYTASDLEEFADRLALMGHRNIIVDLSSTWFLDAACVRVLLKTADRLQKIGGGLAITDPLSPPRKLFQLLKLSNVIPVFLSVEEAEFSLGSFLKR